MVVTDLDVPKSDAMAEQIRQEGGEAISFPGDVTAPDFAER